MQRVPNKHIDLQQSFYAKDSMSRDERHKVEMVIALAALAVIIAGIWGFYILETNRLQRIILPVSVSVTQPDTVALYNRSLELERQRDTLLEIRSNLESAGRMQDSYPGLTKDILTQVWSIDSDVTVNTVTYTAESGGIAIEGSTARPENVAEYAEKLRSSGNYRDIEYRGYTAEEIIGIASYNFTMTAVINVPEVQP